MKRRYNWIPDKADKRDLKYRKSSRARTKPLPQKTDLTSLCSPIENQKNIGSCSAQALVGNMEFLEKKTAEKFINLSRLFVYYNERSMEGTADQDSGAQLRDGIKTLNKQGVCPEKIWPYQKKLVLEQPAKSCYTSALSRRISSYTRLQNLDDMKDCLASGFPFVFGFQVFSNFESEEVAQTGVLGLPSPQDTFMGGHAVMAVGYDDKAEQFIVRNSWGKAWGRQGYFRMPYSYITDPKLAGDFWSIRK